MPTFPYLNKHPLTLTVLDEPVKEIVVTETSSTISVMEPSKNIVVTEHANTLIEPQEGP